MITPRQKKTWANKVNSLQAQSFTQKQAWAVLMVVSETSGLEIPSFEDVYEIPKP